LVLIFLETLLKSSIPVLFARTAQAILNCIAFHYLDDKFNVLPAGTTSTAITTAIGVAFSEFLFYFYKRRR